MPVAQGAYDDATSPDDLSGSCFAIGGVRPSPCLVRYRLSSAIGNRVPSVDRRRQGRSGRVRISPNFEVTATRAGKLWIGQQVNELANGCSRPRQITASWLGLHVETHDVCDRASPPDPVLLQSEPPTREQPRTDDFSTASHVVGCAISIVGFALASAALIASGGSMFWWGIAALGWSTVAFVHSCGQVVSVASKKHNGWGHDRRYATSGYDSHGYYHRVYYDANHNRYW